VFDKKLSVFINQADELMALNLVAVLQAQVFSTA
jgi:hypothetical protein